MYLNHAGIRNRSNSIKNIIIPNRPKHEEIRERFEQRAKELGIPDLLDRIADETVGTDEASVLEFLKKKDHPALKMEPIMG